MLRSHSYRNSVKLPKDTMMACQLHDSTKEHYKQIYYEALDHIISCVEDRFDQPGYRIYKTLEMLIIKACNQEDFKEDLQTVCDFYQDDLVKLG